MCESNAYLLKNGKEELLMESVDIIEPQDGGFRLIGIFGDRKSVKGRLVMMNLVRHRIVFTEEGEAGQILTHEEKHGHEHRHEHDHEHDHDGKRHYHPHAHVHSHDHGHAPPHVNHDDKAHGHDHPGHDQERHDHQH